MTEKILVSSCLLGDRVRYNGAHKRSDHEVLQRWIREGRVVPVCPEVAGGLPVPRPPAEIIAAGNVVDPSGRDVSEYFDRGAQHALELSRANAIRIAILKEGSPSCGTGYTYDGTFTGTKVPRPGITAALLQQAGVYVFNENQLAEAEALLKELESSMPFRDRHDR